MSVKHTLSGTVLLALLAAEGAAHAQAQPLPATGGPSISQLEQQLNEQEAALKETRRNLERLKIRMQAPGAAGAAPAARESRPVQSAQQEHLNDGVETEPVVGKAPTANPQQSAAAKVAPILDQPGILTPRNHFVLEPSLQYDYSNSNQVNLIGFSVLPAILVGLIDVREVDTSTAIGAITGRYGLTNRLELNAKVSYVAGHQSTTMRPLTEGASNDEVFSNSGNGIGDIQLGARYQFNDGGANMPYLIGSLQASLPTGKGPFDVPYSSGTAAPGGMPLQKKQPTGSGFYALDAGVLAIYPSDPAVFFGGLDYTWRPSRNINKTIGGLYIGRVRPGNSAKLSFGMGISLNEKASFSVGYQHTYVQGARYAGNNAVDSHSVQVGQLMVGYGYQLSPNVNANLTLGVGVTRYAPAAELLLRVPFSF